MKDFKDFAASIDWPRARKQSHDATVLANAFNISKQHQLDSENTMLVMALLEQYHEWLHLPGDD